ncbi:hypothetical protein [Nocardia sp. NBC_01329]|uniref:hypothetical protein n=1 Tax=Nocardia sp. NBC_01329 TaxID=2903594 RepID=UPI002E14703F|nr:hypothetical protein OG405_03815 [Nocardia sp. NBC_01329]
MVIRDDNQVDHYGRTLAAAFTARFHDDPQRLVERPETYDSGVSTAASTFRRMLPNICQNAPDTIYFAGRAGHALGFLTALAERNCRTPIRILTADDMAGRRLDGSPAGIALETGVSVLYTGQVHPQAWSDDPDRFSPSALGQFADDCAGDVCFRAFSEDGNLEDFAAIMEYDAAGTAVEAIRRAAEYAGPIVAPGQVVQEMKQMHGATAILGASGRLDFDENGLPINKTIPILETKVGEPTAYVGLP